MTITSELLRRLLDQQFPDLAELPVGELFRGWDNTTARLGSELAIRLPHRPIGARTTAHEIAWLPRLAPQLPLPVPVPLRFGSPAFGYPWRWSVCRWVPGESVLQAPWDAPDAAAFALAEFLQALHRPAPADAPDNPFRAVPLVDRQADVERLLGEFTDYPHPQVDTVALETRWCEAMAAPAYSGPPVWVHGDLHPGNLVVHRGRLARVIDFGDLCAGDPAVDFAIGWMAFEGSGRSALRESATVDDDTWLRAGGWAVLLGLVMVSDSRAGAELARVGARTLGAIAEGVGVES